MLSARRVAALNSWSQILSELRCLNCAQGASSAVVLNEGV